ncbi:hypothetical protein [Brevundimonas sp.]|uniref:hypothetical protein n=1 Tax=Brevundimonas sp. TaxID=1871086 RepID=UPI00356172FD
MGSRIMNWLPAVAGFFTLAGLADTAAGQCGPVCPPPPCCGSGRNFDVNANVNVGAGADADARVRSGLNARAGGGVFVCGGGAARVTVDQPSPTTISGLNVEGARVRKTIRVPHPASRVRPDREVHGDYEGELYRCLSGAFLQMTWAEYQGEALWHGRSGMVECRTQKSERDCNERSLLRRYGAGVKIMTMVREETYTEYREEVIEEAGIAVSGATISLDGGVGGRVF